MFTIDTSSFAANTKQDEYAIKYGWQDGTIALTFRGKTKTLTARKTERDEYIVWGIASRYPTGSKVWDTCIRFKDGKVVDITSGVDSRSGRLARSPMVVGFMSDVADQHHSKR